MFCGSIVLARVGILGGIEWSSAVDGERGYFAVSDAFTDEPGGLHAVKLSTGGVSLGDAGPATGLREWARVHERATRRNQRDSGRRLFRCQRWWYPSLRYPRRLDHLGVRHQPRVLHREWDHGQAKGGINQWPRTYHRRRDGLSKFRVRFRGRATGKRPSRLRGQTRVSIHRQSLGASHVNSRSPTWGSTVLPGDSLESSQR